MMGKVFVVHRYSKPLAVFSSPEKAALWIYEHRNDYCDNAEEFVEFEIDHPPSPKLMKED